MSLFSQHPGEPAVSHTTEAAYLYTGLLFPSRISRKAGALPDHICPCRALLEEAQ